MVVKDTLIHVKIKSITERKVLSGKTIKMMEKRLKVAYAGMAFMYRWDLKVEPLLLLLLLVHVVIGSHQVGVSAAFKLFESNSISSSAARDFHIQGF